jgi:hypothetical protein
MYVRELLASEGADLYIKSQHFHRKNKYSKLTQAKLLIIDFFKVIPRVNQPLAATGRKECILDVFLVLGPTVIGF